MSRYDYEPAPMPEITEGILRSSGFRIFDRMRGIKVTVAYTDNRADAEMIVLALNRKAFA